MIITVEGERYQVKKHPKFTFYASSECGSIFARPAITARGQKRGGQRPRADYWVKLSPMLVKAKHTPIYGKFRVTQSGITKLVYAHRFILECWDSVQPRHVITRHLNGNSLDNRLCNLKYGTIQENVDDSFKHDGNYAQGKRNGRAKLTENDVIKIRMMSANGNSVISIHKKYEFVSKVSISNVIRGITWSHL